MSQNSIRVKLCEAMMTDYQRIAARIETQTGISAWRGPSLNMDAIFSYAIVQMARQAWADDGAWEVWAQRYYAMLAGSDCNERGIKLSGTARAALAMLCDKAATRPDIRHITRNRNGGIDANETLILFCAVFWLLDTL